MSRFPSCSCIFDSLVFVLISLQLFGMRNTIVSCGWLYVFFFRTYKQIAVLVAFENSMKRISWSWRFSLFLVSFVFISCVAIYSKLFLLFQLSKHDCVTNGNWANNKSSDAQSVKTDLTTALSNNNFVW